MANKPMTDKTRNEIIKRWKDGERNKSQLARQHNTSTRTIGRIIETISKIKAKKEVEKVFKVGNLVIDTSLMHPIAEEVMEVNLMGDLKLKTTGWIKNTDCEVIGTVVHGSAPEVKHIKPEPLNPIATITSMCVMLSIDSSPRVIDMTHPLFNEISEDVKDGRYNAAYEKMDIKTAIENYSEGFLKIVNGDIHYNGQQVNNKLGSKIVKMMADGNESFKAFALFFVKAMENPSKDSREQLMGFVAADDIKISEDGEVLAYKNVKSNYQPSRIGMYDEADVYHADEFYTNRIGDVCSMPRGLVEDNKNITCAHGLHIASLNYLISCWGFSGHNMLVKVHPRDVVSIPTDYNNSKGRVCRYEVIAELSKEEIEARVEKLK